LETTRALLAPPSPRLGTVLLQHPDWQLPPGSVIASATSCKLQYQELIVARDATACSSPSVLGFLRRLSPLLPRLRTDNLPPRTTRRTLPAPQDSTTAGYALDESKRGLQDLELFIREVLLGQCC
jgi:hypothetical protein